MEETVIDVVDWLPADKPWLWMGDCNTLLLSSSLTCAERQLCISQMAEEWATVARLRAVVA